MPPITPEDRALLLKFAEMNDKDLGRAFIHAENAVAQHRGGATRTRQKAHARASEALAACRAALAEELVTCRFKLASRELLPGEMLTLASLYVLSENPLLEIELRRTIDEPPGPGQSDPFTGGADADGWQARRDELGAEVAQLGRVRALRLAVRSEETLGRQLAALDPKEQ